MIQALRWLEKGVDIGVTTRDPERGSGDRDRRDHDRDPDVPPGGTDAQSRNRVAAMAVRSTRLTQRESRWDLSN